MEKYFKLTIGLILAVLISGCQSVTYYSQAVGGQVSIWSKQRYIEEVLTDPSVDEATKARLRRARDARQFASRVLKLPANGSYARYADIERDYVVWNVVVTPAYSVEPLDSCFPVVGCLAYRGYYSRQAAIDYASEQKQSGFDVYVGGVSAYSTLGWFNDPLLNTMFSRSNEALVELIFHELAHQQLYIPDDTRFNESFATAVAQIGLRQWLQTYPSAQPLEAYFAQQQNHREVVRLILDARERMRIAYQQSVTAEEARLAAIKREQFDELKMRYQKLRQQGGGSEGYDRFFASGLNHASLALFGEYHGWVAAFQHLFLQQGSDWKAFYEAVESFSNLPREARDRQLQQLNDTAFVGF